MNVYNTSQKYNEIMSRVEEEAMANGGEIDDVLSDAIEKAEIELEEAIFSVMYDIKESELDLGKVKSAMLELKMKKEKIEYKILTKKRALAMLAGRESFSDGVVSTTKAVSSALVVTGDAPEEYVTKRVVEEVKRSIDKKKAKADIQSGKKLDWCKIEYRKSVK